MGPVLRIRRSWELPEREVSDRSLFLRRSRLARSRQAGLHNAARGSRGTKGASHSLNEQRRVRA